VDLSCKRWEAWEIKFGFVGRTHDRAIGIMDDEWFGGGPSIDDGEIGGAESGSAAAVGDK
jgi:hypothetical protein